MLELKGIIKDYVTGDTSVRALKGISLAFRNCEFVSILGPSGCGKTTMLNILGGLDCYTEGDLLINGRSTKDFAESDWDAYRNSCVGFVFQNYNLIGHQSVLSNVELALTLSGISRQERTKRATEALERVGLGEQIHKKPNQLSGGQMQRVAIARAIVNNPEIILADEPTGALDSKTSLQIVDLLKDISKDKLVVMVTHNDQLAEEYSTRIIRMKDGEIIGDSQPYDAPAYEPTKAEKDLITLIENVPKPDIEGRSPKDAAKLDSQYKKVCDKITKDQKKKMVKERKASLDKTSMSFVTAFKLSLKNLFTKKWRTVMVSVAGSIGIIGIALVLAVSNGFTNYVNKLQSDTLSGFPISISQYTTDLNAIMNAGQNSTQINYDKFPSDDKLIIYEEKDGFDLYYNKITKEYLEYINSDELKALCNDISYSHGMNMNVLTKQTIDGADNYTKVNTVPADMLSSMTGMSNGGYWQELLNNDEFIKTQYNVIEGDYPSSERNADGSFDIAVVVDQFNRISTKTLTQLGLSVEDYQNAKLEDLLKQDIKLILNNDWFTLNSSGNYYDEATSEKYASIFDNGITLRISGVMRISPDAPLGIYNSGVVYPSCITDFLIEDSINSDIGVAQRAGDKIYLPETLLPKVEGIQLRPGMTIPNIKFTIAGITFTKDQIVEMLCQLVAASEMPTGIQIYPKSFDDKAKITAYLDAYNKTATDKILYIDAASIAGSIVEQLINTISIVLVAFAAISLVVSSIMISIITYISVIERTKEIGILRSIGARKKDISRVFNAETVIIGFAAGLIGIIVALILSFPLNAVLVHLAGGFVVGTLVSLSPVAAIVLIIISVALTFLSGLIPSRIASKKDPVKALRTE